MQFRVVFYHLRYVQYGFARNIATSSNNRGGFFRYSNEDIRIKQRVQINYGLPPPTNQKIGKRKTLLANRLTPPPPCIRPIARIIAFPHIFLSSLRNYDGPGRRCRRDFRVPRWRGGGGDKVKVYGGAHNELLNLVM